VVKAVADLIGAGREEVRQSDLLAPLHLDKSAVSRRTAAAIEAGVLRNLEDRRGRPARLVLGDALPDELEILPQPDRLHDCTVAGGVSQPSPSLRAARAEHVDGAEVESSRHSDCGCECGDAALSADPDVAQRLSQPPSTRLPTYAGRDNAST
jgi:hypothetical protein